MTRTSRRQGRSREGAQPKAKPRGAERERRKGRACGVGGTITTKPVDSGLEVNGALEGRKLAFLSGEACFTCGTPIDVSVNGIRNVVDRIIDVTGVRPNF